MADILEDRPKDRMKDVRLIDSPSGPDDFRIQPGSQLSRQANVCEAAVGATPQDVSEA